MVIDLLDPGLSVSLQGRERFAADFVKRLVGTLLDDFAQRSTSSAAVNCWCQMFAGKTVDCPVTEIRHGTPESRTKKTNQ